ncbi:hypothetical protein D3C71_2160160 [compost metagenome]
MILMQTIQREPPDMPAMPDSSRNTGGHVMVNIAAVWSAFVDAMSEQERRFPEFLNEPATEEELLEAEQQLGFPFPE